MFFGRQEVLFDEIAEALADPVLVCGETIALWGIGKPSG